MNKQPLVSIVTIIKNEEENIVNCKKLESPKLSTLQTLSTYLLYNFITLQTF